MNRLISLTALFLGSLTLSAAATQTQTWRLTNDPNDNSLPRVIIGNQNTVWVEWLSSAQGNSDVYCQRYDGGWSPLERLTNDDVNQTSCDIAYNKVTETIWAVWDSAGKIQYARYMNGWGGFSNAVDSMFLFTQTGGIGKILGAASDSGRFFLCWTAHDTTDYPSVYVMQYDSTEWSQAVCVLQGNGYSILYGHECFSIGLVFNILQPTILCNTYSYSHGGFFYVDLTTHYWIPDSGWLNRYVASWSNQTHPHIQWPRPFDLGFSSQNELHVISVMADLNYNNSLIDKIYDIPYLNQIGEKIIQAQKYPQGAAITNLTRPIVAWSDSHSIFLNAYYDTLWSQPPVRISDTYLTNCINPDIVAENDSTVWVCYQNDGDIYVTRTSVPLGVEGRPEQQPVQTKATLQAWPNPAHGTVKINYNPGSSRSSTLRVFDVTGRLVKNIEMTGAMAVWNGKDQNEQGVSSGVYFIRLKANGDEAVQKVLMLR